MSPSVLRSCDPSRPQRPSDSRLRSINTDMKHSSQDLLVYSNGTVKHSVTLSAEINCEVNLFNYPFAFDACPVAIQAWTKDGEAT